MLKATLNSLYESFTMLEYQSSIELNVHLICAFIATLHFHRGDLIRHDENTAPSPFQSSVLSDPSTITCSIAYRVKEFVWYDIESCDTTNGFKFEWHEKDHAFDWSNLVAKTVCPIKSTLYLVIKISKIYVYSQCCHKVFVISAVF